jgi:upstream activation factor subunit UAF30
MAEPEGQDNEAEMKLDTAAKEEEEEEGEEEAEDDDNSEAVTVLDADLKKSIEEILAAGDLKTLTSKKVRKALEKKFKTKLKDKAKKKFINGCIQEYLDAQDNGEEEEPKKKKKGGGGFTTPMQLSTELSEFFDGAITLSRTEVVKKLWAYIKEHELQKPSDKRTILLDDALQLVFKRKTVTMFSMNKFLVPHLKSVGELVDDEEVEVKKEKKKRAKRKREASEDEEEEEEEEDSKKKKKKPKKASVKREKKDGVPGTGIQKEMALSPDLAAVVGCDRLSRPQVVKQLWVYIRAHDLQNPSNKREVTYLITDESHSRFATETLKTPPSLPPTPTPTKSYYI